MPILDLLTLLIERLSETRLLRLAEVRYLTSFIQELETRQASEETVARRRHHVHNAPNVTDLEEAERLFIEERGFLEARTSNRTESQRRPAARQAPVRADRPERPIVASTQHRNHILHRRRSRSHNARQAPPRTRRPTENRTYPSDSVLRRRPAASHIEQAGDLVINSIVDHLNRDIARRAVTHARTTTRRTSTDNTGR